MITLDLTLIWRALDSTGAQLTLLQRDAAGLAPRVIAQTHPLDLAQARAEVRGLRRAIRKAVVRGRGVEALTAHGRLLFDLLLPAAVKRVLRSGSGALTIIADSPEWPWPLLHDGEAPLGLRWALGELELDDGSPAPSAPTEANRMLVVADPAADLPAARYEGEALMRELSNDAAQLGCDLRLGRLRVRDLLRIFGGYRIVHFAGHSDPRDDRGPAGWRLADGRLDARAVGSLAGGAAPSLVFANACQSATEDAAEVGEALLRAGVRHFVGTAVDLPDLPGADFATAFYRALRAGAPIGEAMRQARVAAHEDGQAVWAAYRLQGAPDTIYFRARVAERWTPGVRQAVVLAVRRPWPEQAPDALAEAHQAWRGALRDLVGRHGGRLLPGRAVVDRAVFGVPVTFENDAVRAIRAAEAVRAVVPEATIVLEAGPVVATGVDVVGEVAFAAERVALTIGAGLHGLPGVVRRLGAGADWEPAVDGLARFRGLRERSSVDEAPLVGRAAEIERLSQLAGRVEASRQAEAVTLVAPAGMGKSRLVDAFARRLSGRFTVVRGVGQAYGEGAAFAAAAGIIRGLAGVGDDASLAEVGAALDRLIDRLDDDGAPPSLDDVLSIDALLTGEVGGPQLSEHRVALAAMAGLDGRSAGPAPDPSTLPTAFRLLLEAAAADRPLVVVFEDVHWLPDVGRAVVEGVLGELGDVPLLVVATARPGFFDQPRPGFEGPRIARMDLGPLSDREAEALVRHLLSKAPREIVATLRARAEGNPLFLRELALARHGGDEDDAPPPTVEAVMQARLDRLPPLAREVMRAAAVLGRTFWREGVERLLGRTDGVAEALRLLERRRMVLVQPTSVLPSLSQWRFGHALMHEVVYHGIAGRARAAWHGRAALWLADEVDAGPDRWARIAVHRAAAGDSERAASDWLAAARRARETYAPAEERRALTEGLAQDDLAGGRLTGEVRADAEVRLADLDRGAGDLEAARARLEAAIARTPVDRPVARAARLKLLAQIYENQGDIAAARAQVVTGQSLLEGRGGREALLVRLELDRFAGWLDYRDGDLDGAHSRLTTLIGEVPDDAGEMRGLISMLLGIVHYRRGVFPDAERAFRQALALFEREDARHRMASCFNNLGMLAVKQGDARGAVRWYEQAVRLHARRGDRTALAQTYNNLGSCYGELGDYARAAQYLRESVRIRARTGHGGLALGYANLGEALLKQGRTAEAQGYLEQAITLCAEGRGPAYLLPDAWRTLAELHLEVDAPDAAVEAAEHALSSSEAQGDRLLSGAALRVLGEALDRTGALEDADARLKAAIEVLEPLDSPFELARAYAARARHLERRGAPEAAALAERAEALRATVQN